MGDTKKYWPLSERLNDDEFWQAAKMAFHTPRGLRAERSEISVDGRPVTRVRLIQEDDGQREIMTLSDLVDILGLPEKFLRDKTERRAQMRDRHPLPHFRIGRALRFERSKIKVWLQACVDDATINIRKKKKKKA